MPMRTRANVAERDSEGDDSESGPVRPESKTAMALAMEQAQRKTTDTTVVPIGGGSKKRRKPKRSEIKAMSAADGGVTHIHRGGQTAPKEIEPAPEMDETTRQIKELLQRGASSPEYRAVDEDPKVDLGDNLAADDDRVWLQAALRYGNPISTKLRTIPGVKMVKGEECLAPQRAVRMRFAKGVYKTVPDELIRTEIDLRVHGLVKCKPVYGGTEITEEQQLKQMLLKEEITARIEGKEPLVVSGYTISGVHRPNPRSEHYENAHVTFITGDAYLDWMDNERYVERIVTKRFYHRPGRPVPTKAAIKANDRVVDTRTENVPGTYGLQNLADDEQDKRHALLGKRYGAPLSKPDRQCVWVGATTKRAWKRAKAEYLVRQQESEDRRKDKGLPIAPPVLEASDSYTPTPKWWWFLRNPSGLTNILYTEGVRPGIVDPDAAQENADGLRREVGKLNDQVIRDKGYGSPVEETDTVSPSHDEVLAANMPSDTGQIHGPNNQPRQGNYEPTYFRPGHYGERTLSGWDFGAYNYTQELLDREWEQMLAEAEVDETEASDQSEPTPKSLPDGGFRFTAHSTKELEEAIKMWGAATEHTPANGVGDAAFPLKLTMNVGGRFISYDLTTLSGIDAFKQDKAKLEQNEQQIVLLSALYQMIEDYVDGQRLGAEPPAPEEKLDWPILVKSPQTRYMDTSNVYREEINRLRRAPTPASKAMSRLAAISGAIKRAKVKRFLPEARGRGYIAAKMAEREAIDNVRRMASMSPAQRQIEDAQQALRAGKQALIREKSAALYEKLRLKREHEERRAQLNAERLERYSRQRRAQLLHEKRRKEARELRGRSYRMLAKASGEADAKRYERWLKRCTKNHAVIRTCQELRLEEAKKRQQRANEVRQVMIEREEERLQQQAQARRERHVYLMTNSMLYRASHNVVSAANEFLDKFRGTPAKEAASIPPTVGEVETDIPRQPAEDTGSQREDNTAKFLHVDARRIDERTRKHNKLRSEGARRVNEATQEALTALAESEELPEDFEQTATGIVYPKGNYRAPHSPYKQRPYNRFRELWDRINNDL